MPASIHATARGTAPSSRRRWPLLLIGAAAGTATWSGWVGLGQLTGFGVVHPLPGIWDGATLNTAITLPIGVEAYAVYALSVATDTRPLTTTGRRYAWASSAGALILGMAGQIAYHLMDAKAVGTAPWWIVAHGLVPAGPGPRRRLAAVAPHRQGRRARGRPQSACARSREPRTRSCRTRSRSTRARPRCTRSRSRRSPPDRSRTRRHPSIPPTAPAVVPKNGAAVPAPVPGRPAPAHSTDTATRQTTPRSSPRSWPPRPCRRSATSRPPTASVAPAPSASAPPPKPA